MTRRHWLNNLFRGVLTLPRQLKELQGENSRLLSQIQALERGIEVCRERAADLQKRVEELRRFNQQIQDQKLTLQSEMDKLKEESRPFRTVDVPSPRDIIPKSDIRFMTTERRIEIRNIDPNIWLTTVADTNSMDPTIDLGHTCILTDNFDPADLVAGDIIVFERPRRAHLVIHRIYSISEDQEGRVFQTKGDNNTEVDPWATRDANIKWLLIGIIF